MRRDARLITTGSQFCTCAVYNPARGALTQFHIDGSRRSNQLEIAPKYNRICGFSKNPKISRQELSDFELQFTFDPRANLLHPPTIHTKIAISSPRG